MIYNSLTHFKNSFIVQRPRLGISTLPKLLLCSNATPDLKCQLEKPQQKRTASNKNYSLNK
jgi:hypothetical protein